MSDENETLILYRRRRTYSSDSSDEDIIYMRGQQQKPIYCMSDEDEKMLVEVARGCLIAGKNKLLSQQGYGSDVNTVEMRKFMENISDLTLDRASIEKLRTMNFDRKADTLFASAGIARSILIDLNEKILIDEDQSMSRYTIGVGMRMLFGQSRKIQAMHAFINHLMRSLDRVPTFLKCGVITGAGILLIVAILLWLSIGNTAGARRRDEKLVIHSGENGIKGKGLMAYAKGLMRKVLPMRNSYCQSTTECRVEKRLKNITREIGRYRSVVLELCECVDITLNGCDERYGCSQGCSYIGENQVTCSQPGLKTINCEDCGESCDCLFKRIDCSYYPQFGRLVERCGGGD